VQDLEWVRCFIINKHTCIQNNLLNFLENEKESQFIAIASVQIRRNEVVFSQHVHRNF